MYLGFSLLAFLIAATGTGILLRYALKRKVLDVPNERSSHKVPTPRGAGLAIVVATIAAFVFLAWFDVLKLDLLLALSGGIAVATVGFLDDHRPLPAGVRLAVHLCAALWALFWLGGLPSLRVADQLVQFGWTGYVLGALGIVWMLNLFNFMDGIDGIAASEAIFVACGGASLALFAGLSIAVPAAAFILGAACCGFLLWNWPPAKIFMGDVGSGYLGYTIAVLAVAAAREHPVVLPIWLILGGAFIVDATVTLVRRLVRRERIYQAHRSHAYQWLARRWNSHRRVTLTVTLVNLVWLFPAAWLAAVYPGRAVWIAVGALLPLVVLALAAGAGRAEEPRII
jgi:Fuc2NAc and GlcNAc transferase